MAVVCQQRVRASDGPAARLAFPPARAFGGACPPHDAELLGHCPLSSKHTGLGSPSLTKATTSPYSTTSLVSGCGRLASAPWQWRVPGEGRTADPQQATRLAHLCRQDLVCNCHLGLQKPADTFPKGTSTDASRLGPSLALFI